MKHNKVLTMAAESSTNITSTFSTSHEIDSEASSSIQPAIFDNLSNGDNLLLNNSKVNRNTTTTTTTVITLNNSIGDIVPVITQHNRNHLNINNNNNNNNINSHQHHHLSLQCDDLLNDSSPSSTSYPMLDIDTSLLTTTQNTININGTTTICIDDCSPSTTTTTIINNSNNNRININQTNDNILIDNDNSPIVTLSPTSVPGLLIGSTTSTSHLQICSTIDDFTVNNRNILDCNNSRNIIVNNSCINSVDETIQNDLSILDVDNITNTTCNTTTTTTTSNNDTSGTTSSSIIDNDTKDNLNININNDDSISSESIDIEIKDITLDENGGYQDNTSSNSQQSAGGGSIGGNGSINGVNNNNNNNIGGGNNNNNNNNNNNGGNYLSLLPPTVGTTGGTNLTQCGSEQTDFKYLFEELCPVCGDKVSGYHYGLLTCESCKGFFKRTVQNKKVYTCVAERSCHIDKTQRKRCPYCRFQKCLEVGMKLEAVRADRMRGGRNKFGPMYKRDRARKLQMMRQRQLAIQAIRGSISSTDVKPAQLSPTGYQQTYPSMSIKQEIQIPQVSSLTQSPDSSPSPIAVALGQVTAGSAIIQNSLIGGGGSGGSANSTTVSGTSGGGSAGTNGTCGPGSDTTSGSSLQHSTDSKLCFDSGTNPTSSADSVSTVEPLRVSPMIREFVQSIDDREWQTQLFTLLQKQSYNQVEVDLFELMCKVLDQNLFSQVDWARNTVFFKDLKVDDQMKLLQHSWSDMLVLDHLHQRIHNGLPDDTPLHNGQIFNLLGLGLLGVPQLGDYFNELQNKLQELKFDMGDYVCMKFLILLNPNVRGIINRKTVLEGHENVQAALLDYTLTCYPSVTDKFSRLLSILPEIHAMAARGEEHLYLKHCTGSAPTQTLLMEMLHAKRKVW